MSIKSKKEVLVIGVVVMVVVVKGKEVEKEEII